MTDQITARNPEGTVLLERPKSALERANEEHGPAQQTEEWQVHPECHNPPGRFGICTMRFPDGRYWCFGCEVAWEPSDESRRLTKACAVPVTAQPCPEHGGHLAQLSNGLWCTAGSHLIA